MLPLSLRSTIEELLERKSNGFDLENLDYGSQPPVMFSVLEKQNMSVLTKKYFVMNTFNNVFGKTLFEFNECLY
jgi:hypothetical protein